MASYQQRIGQQDEAAATLRLARQSVENLPQETADDLYGLAKVYAALARSRGPEQEAMGQLARAIAGDRAVAKGYRDIAAMEEDSALAGIQTREDCQRLLAVFKLEQEIEKVCKDPEKLRRWRGSARNCSSTKRTDWPEVPITRALRELCRIPRAS